VKKSSYSAAAVTILGIGSALGDESSGDQRVIATVTITPGDSPLWSRAFEVGDSNRQKSIDMATKMAYEGIADAEQQDDDNPATEEADYHTTYKNIPKGQKLVSITHPSSTPTTDITVDTNTLEGTNPAGDGAPYFWTTVTITVHTTGNGVTLTYNYE